MGRIVAIDFGLKRIGIAVSDERKKIAFPLETVEGGPRAIENIKKALGAKLSEVEKFLLGNPLLLNGKPSEMGARVQAFAKNLETAFLIPVEWIDERLSSRWAEQSLASFSLNRKERTAQLDTATAALLLQSYLDQTK
jgi:putative Holliday junction resolvase